MTTKTDDYIAGEGLEVASDAKEERPVHRKPGFDGLVSFSEMEQTISENLKRIRIEKKLSRAELARLLGSVESVYGRYERTRLKLHATQVLHLCELLGIYPDDLLFEAAPHIWGNTADEALERRRIIKIIQDLPQDSLKTLGSVLDGILALQNTSEK